MAETKQHPESLISWKKVEGLVRERLQVLTAEEHLYSELEVQVYRKALEWILRDVLEVSVI